MNWSATLPLIYLLGMLFTAAVIARPVRRVMGAGSDARHAEVESHQDANMIVLFVVTGVAALWPMTLSLFVISRFIPASDMADDDHVSAGLDVALADRASTFE